MRSVALGNMTSRERLLTVIANKEPDRIPVSTGIDEMIAIRKSGIPSWELGINNLTMRSRIDANAPFEADNFYYMSLAFKGDLPVRTETYPIHRGADKWMTRTVTHTPEGELTSVTTYPRDNPGVLSEKCIKDFKENFWMFKYLYPELTGYDAAEFREVKKLVGEDGIVVLFVPTPGMQELYGLFNDSLEAVVYAYYDYPELFEELRVMQHRNFMQRAEMCLDAGCDVVLTGGSGSLTLQSPALWDELAFPTLKEITAMCKQAGKLSLVHCCGKSRHLVERCALETDLNCVHPLEIPPQGDIDLREIKEKFGYKIALSGNLHTTDVMLFGTPAIVRQESLKCMRDAGMGGGFYLSPGDQCGRDTPDENIFAMVNAAKELGSYPLDIGRIEEEIAMLEHKKQAERPGASV